MKIIKVLLIKEFKQIFRNKSLLPMIFVMPIIQLLVMPLAADYTIKNINIAVVDHDRSAQAKMLLDKITASGYFRLVDYGNNYKQAYTLIESDKADLIIEIPHNFEKDLLREGQQQLLIAVNAINGMKATIGASYVSAIIAAYNQNLLAQINTIGAKPSFINVISNNWYNIFMRYQIFMVPGILVIFVTMVGAYMCSLNIVKEKEIGTIEQINVTPIKKYHYILGKLIPFWIIGVVIFSIGFFGVAYWVYGIVPLGNVLLLYGYLAVYLVALLGFGLLISTYADTQQQAMSVAFFFMMIFILMSGLFTPIEAMPAWAKAIAHFNPVTYFIEVMRMIVLKGSGFYNIRTHFLVIIGFAFLFNFWAIWNYKKTSG
ncbi:MAG: ABC transporter permease [Bacteroidetes bacterium]|nr:ABC transporter permease [Bacteroidota bacterium]MCB9044089.1 ABC transporter permease [Chitinophagales bacterium]